MVIAYAIITNHALNQSHATLAGSRIISLAAKVNDVKGASIYPRNTRHQGCINHTHPSLSIMLVPAQKHFEHEQNRQTQTDRKTDTDTTVIKFAYMEILYLIRQSIKSGLKLYTDCQKKIQSNFQHQ